MANAPQDRGTISEKTESLQIGTVPMRRLPSTDRKVAVRLTYRAEFWESVLVRVAPALGRKESCG
jgi:hypothetical protein